MLGTGLTDPTPSWKQKIDPSFLELPNQTEPMEALVWMNSTPIYINKVKSLSKQQKGEFVYSSLLTRSGQSQQGITEWLKEKHINYKSLYIVDLLKVKLLPYQLEILAKRSDVKFISPNPRTKIISPIEEIEARSLDSVEWGIQKINADDVWDLEVKGEGAVIGGQDTGVTWDHSTLKEKYRGYNSDLETVDHNYNWHDAISEINPLNQDTIITETTNPCGLQLAEPCDDHNHGSWTMGTMLGSDSTNNIGVAPGAKWIACRNMERGWGTPFSYLECFQWFLAPTDINNINADPLKAPDVINNSWSCPEIEGCTPETFLMLEEAVNNLTDAGIFVVVSAGNDGRDGCGSVRTPSSIFEKSFTVGASDQADNIAGFSSRGPVLVDNSMRMKPDVVAPGIHIRSAKRNEGFLVSSGTSASGPHVAGTVALMISANPALAGNIETIRQILIDTAVPLAVDSVTCGDIGIGEVPNNVFGWGRIDALAAVKAAQDLVSNTEEIIDVAEKSFKLYPNPVQSELTLESLSSVDYFVIEFRDITGNLVLRKRVHAILQNTLKLDLSSFSTGVYFYQIKTNNALQTGKVIKL
jgi:subtilisin family serine protease